MTATLDALLDTLPAQYAGPGGAVAVLRDGAVLASRAWGWADADRRIPFTAQTMALVCSITKQFTCALLLDQFPDPSVLNDDIARRMPLLHGAVPTAHELAHNQSGLRDYWALAMLCGAPPEGIFGQPEAERLIARTAALHFVPGTSYSYCNQNFRILSDLVQARIDRPFAELLRERILAPAGMPHARLSPDTAEVPGGTVGYEGSVAAGFTPAVNRIVWTGDAGLAACLDDMVAWERFIDAARDDPGGLYNRLSTPTTFRDGAPAAYGYGLSRMTLSGHAVTGHGGGLRGWRSFRLHCAALRVSVVVLFNHMADARAAAIALFAALLDAPQPAAATGDATGWDGRFLAPQTGLAVQLDPLGDGTLRLHYGTGAEILHADGAGGFAAGQSRLRRAAGGIALERCIENQTMALLACDPADAPAPEGVFYNAELDARLTCVAAGGVPYGAFSGALGEGTMLALQPHGRDVWLLPCPRALDYAAPGDWTLLIRRGEGGRITGIDVGCWLARHVTFTAQPASPM